MNILKYFMVKEENPIMDNFLSKVTELELKYSELENKHKKLEQKIKKFEDKTKKLEDTAKKLEDTAKKLEEKIKKYEKHDIQLLDIIDRTNKTEEIINEHIEYNIYYRNIINNLLQKKLI
jgi:predicted nuclease with TOPRIM domain